MTVEQIENLELTSKEIEAILEGNNTTNSFSKEELSAYNDLLETAKETEEAMILENKAELEELKGPELNNIDGENGNFVVVYTNKAFSRGSVPEAYIIKVGDFLEFNSSTIPFHDYEKRISGELSDDELRKNKDISSVSMRTKIGYEVVKGDIKTAQATKKSILKTLNQERKANRVVSKEAKKGVVSPS